METELVKISKLAEQKQWTTWKFQVTIVLKAQDVWDVVTGAEKPPVESTSDYAKLLKDYKKKDITAQRIIATSICDQPLKHLVTCANSSEMWAKLLSVFEQNTSQGQHFLQQKFYTLEKCDDDDVASFISKMEEIVKQLGDLGTIIPENMVVQRILVSLPASFNHFHSAWESTSQTEQTLNNLRTRLMIEEKRMQTQESSEESGALFAKKFKNRKFANKGDHYKGKKPGKCFLCNKDTHWKKDCPLRENASKALISECMVAVNHKDMWFLDSGATEHMSMRKEWFDTYVQLTEAHPVRIGNGNVINAVGRGNINISAFNGATWTDRFLLDVLHVPEIHTNLFSQGRTCDKGHVFMSDNEQCEFVAAESGEVVVTGVRETGLFRMLIRKRETPNVSESAAFKCESLRVWHKRLAHQNVSYVKRFLQLRNIQYKDEQFQCEPCILGKHHRLPFSERKEKETECGAIIHADVCGPIEVKSYGGASYFLLLKDDYSHYRMAYFLKKKSDVAGKIVEFIKATHQQTNFRVKTVRFDNGGEFVNDALTQFYANEGIKQVTTISYTPEQNGTIERENRTIVEAARTQLHAYGLDKRLWAEAVNESVYVLNCTGTSTVKDKTPHQLWHNKDANIDKLREFGIAAYIHIPKQKRKKFDAKAIKCVLVGYCDNGYRVFNPCTQKVFSARDIIFGIENHNDKDDKDVKNNEKEKNEKQMNEKKESKKEKMPKRANKNQSEDDNDIILCIKNNESVLDDVVERETSNDSESAASDDEPNNTLINNISDASISNVNDSNVNTSNVLDDSNSSHSSNDVTFVDANGSQTEDLDETVRDGSEICDLTQRNVIDTRLRSRVNSIDTAMLAIYEPQTYKDAMQSSEKEQWIEAMREEYVSLVKNNTWCLVDLPKGETVIDNRWVFKVKVNADDSIDRFKARLVARGFTQVYGINYTETFSPVVRFSSIRTILAVAAKNKMSLRQFDIKTAFLNGDLSETVYMKQPIGFSDGTNKVCKLSKSLYGLKQASRCWNEKFTHFIKVFKFVQSNADPCVFIRKTNGETIVLAIYVDDGLLAATNESCFRPVIDFLSKHFEVKELEAKCYLGLQIDQRIDGSIFISQKSYAKKVIERFGMVDAHPVSTPMENHHVLQKNDNGKTTVFPYREAIGSLHFLADKTRPDICFAVNFLSRFMEKPTDEHVAAVKRVIKYLKKTLNVGLFYFSNTTFDVQCYSDADFAGCLDTRRSTTGFCITLGGSLLSWCSERQELVSRSTTESEYIAGSEAIRELIWMKRLLVELIGPFSCTLYMDNASAVKLVKNPEQHKRTKHIDVRFHFIREKFYAKQFELKQVSSHDQLADIFTKAMPEARISFLKKALNIKEI